MGIRGPEVLGILGCGESGLQGFIDSEVDLRIRGFSDSGIQDFGDSGIRGSRPLDVKDLKDAVFE